MTYDLWKTRDPNDTGFYDMPEDDGPTELDIAYQRIEALVSVLENLCHATFIGGLTADNTSAFLDAKRILGSVGGVKND